MKKSRKKGKAGVEPHTFIYPRTASADDFLDLPVPRDPVSEKDSDEFSLLDFLSTARLLHPASSIQHLASLHSFSILACYYYMGNKTVIIVKLVLCRDPVRTHRHGKEIDGVRPGENLNIHTFGNEEHERQHYINKEEPSRDLSYRQTVN